MFWRSRAFINIDSTIPTKLVGHCRRDRCADPLSIEANRSEELRRIAVVDETVGQAQQQDPPLNLEAGKGFAHRAARASHHLMLFHGDDQMMAVGKLPHELD